MPSYILATSPRTHFCNHALGPSFVHAPIKTKQKKISSSFFLILGNVFIIFLQLRLLQHKNTSTITKKKIEKNAKVRRSTTLKKVLNFEFWTFYKKKKKMSLLSAALDMVSHN
jgi:hypothetical protein